MIDLTNAGAAYPSTLTFSPAFIGCEQVTTGVYECAT